jgi:hypothetical protein
MTTHQALHLPGVRILPEEALRGLNRSTFTEENKHDNNHLLAPREPPAYLHLVRLISTDRSIFFEAPSTSQQKNSSSSTSQRRKQQENKAPAQTQVESHDDDNFDEAEVGNDDKPSVKSRSPESSLKLLGSTSSELLHSMLTNDVATALPYCNRYIKPNERDLPSK